MLWKGSLWQGLSDPAHNEKIKKIKNLNSRNEKKEKWKKRKILIAKIK